MTHRRLLACLALLALPSLATAVDPLPGLWEISLEARVAAESGFQPPAQSTSQCLTKADARDPSRVLGPLAGSGSADCRYTRTGYEDSVFRFTLQCTSPLPLSTTGEVTFSASAVHGTMKTISKIAGHDVEFTSTLTGRRVGDC